MEKVVWEWLETQTGRLERTQVSVGGRPGRGPACLLWPWPGVLPRVAAPAHFLTRMNSEAHVQPQGGVGAGKWRLGFGRRPV